MAPLVATVISEWNGRSSSGKVGLIAISFDLRNHGRRQTNATGIEVWRTGNQNHALDLISVCHDTASDLSLLITYIPAYLFPSGRVSVIKHLCCGVSLGGHVTWQLLLSEKRITTNIILLGCADLFGMLTDRARRSKVPQFNIKVRLSEKFLGSEAFPATLVTALRDIDAAQRIMGSSYGRPKEARVESEAAPSLKKLREEFKGKSVLVVSGGLDKMAPFGLSKPPIEFLETAAHAKLDGGRKNTILVKTVIVPGVAH